MGTIEVVVPVRLRCPAAPTPAQLARARDGIELAVGRSIDASLADDDLGPGGAVRIVAPRVALPRMLREPARSQITGAVMAGIGGALRARSEAVTARFGPAVVEGRGTRMTAPEAVTLLWEAYVARAGGPFWPPPRGEHPGVIARIAGLGESSWLIVALGPPLETESGMQFEPEDLVHAQLSSVGAEGTILGHIMPGGTEYRFERRGAPRSYAQIAADHLAAQRSRLRGPAREAVIAQRAAALAEARFGRQPYVITPLGVTVLFPEDTFPDVVVAVAEHAERAARGEEPSAEPPADGRDPEHPAHEPLYDVDNLPRLHALAAQVADVLSMPAPAGDTDLPPFLMRAAARYDELARAAGDAGAAETTPSQQRGRPQGDGNNGVVDVAPSPSPALDALRSLGAALGPAAAMVPDCAKIAAWTPSTTQSPFAVMRSFLTDATHARSQAVARQVAEASRVILLQQLRSSAQTIAARRSERGFAETVTFIGSALRVLGPDLELFLLLQRALRSERLGRSATAASAGGALGGPLAIARGPATVADVIGHARDAWRSTSHLTPEMWTHLLDVELRHRDDGTVVAVWRQQELTDADLTQRIAAQRRLMNLVDPLFVQIEAIEPLAMRVRRDSDHLSETLRDLLSEMATANANLTTDVLAADTGAWRALATSRYVESASRASGLRYELHGIHALAHAALAEGVDGAEATAAFEEGINAALWHEHANDIALQVVGGVGMVALAILCAPLGPVVAGIATVASGGALAAYDYLEAMEAESTFRALEDPEQILLWHDVEVAQIMAVVSIGLSLVTDVLPVARGAIGAVRAEVSAALRTGLERGVRELAQTSMRAAYRETVEQMARQVGVDLVQHAVTQLVVGAVLERLLPLVLAPILGALTSAIQAEHGSPSTAGGAPADGASDPGILDDLPPGEYVDERWLRAQIEREEATVPTRTAGGPR